MKTSIKTFGIILVLAFIASPVLILLNINWGNILGLVSLIIFVVVFLPLVFWFRSRQKKKFKEQIHKSMKEQQGSESPVIKNFKNKKH